MIGNKQLLILSSSYPSSDTDGRAAGGFFIKDFVERLSESHNIKVITQYTGDGSKITKEKRYSVVRFPWPGQERPLSTLRLPKDIFAILSVMIAGITESIRQVRIQKVDHVIAMWAIPGGVWALALKKIYKIPYTVWCLGADIWNYQNSPFARIVLKIVLKNATHVYADGFELSESVNEIAQVECSYLPTARFLLNPANKITLKPEGVRHYLFVGRFHPNKGPDIFLRAIQLLPTDLRSQIHCHLFGGGPLTEELEELIETLEIEDTVTLAGFVGEEELAQLIYSSDVVVIPSRNDTISMMVSSALYMNKNIIATEVGDMGHVLKKYNVGRLVSANSPESLAQAIEDDLFAPDKQYSGRSSLLELLDISNAVNRMVDDIAMRRSEESSLPNDD